MRGRSYLKYRVFSGPQSMDKFVHAFFVYA